jgi:serine/threonine-protein kinase HipA
MAGLIEVYVDLGGQPLRVGTLYRESARNREAVSFEYHADWLDQDQRFALEPALQVGRGRFYPEQGREMFSAIGDSAPDTWGRQLMRRAERRRADAEGRAPHTLHETDFLLGVSDISRLGALRFKTEGDEVFQAPTDGGVPGFVRLGRLLESAQRIERGEETDEDLQMIFAPGSSLGGARPKASVMDNQGLLSIAKFPKDTDEYSIETWEHIALTLAERSGIFCSEHQLVQISNRPVLLSKRFDRGEQTRIPFLSAMSLLQLKDGDRSSYPDIVDALTHVGASVKKDALELFRRMVFSILISNVDDHLRNHGFLLEGKAGWRLSPVYDLNPTPQDVRARVLSTSISPEDANCSIPLALEQAPYFNIKQDEAKQIIHSVGQAVSTWRGVASKAGQTPSQIERMASAFEHDDLDVALSMGG